MAKPISAAPGLFHGTQSAIGAVTGAVIGTLGSPTQAEKPARVKGSGCRPGPLFSTALRNFGSSLPARRRGIARAGRRTIPGRGRDAHVARAPGWGFGWRRLR